MVAKISIPKSLKGSAQSLRTTLADVSAINRDALGQTLGGIQQGIESAGGGFAQGIGVEQGLIGEAQRLAGRSVSDIIGGSQFGAVRESLLGGRQRTGITRGGLAEEDISIQGLAALEGIQRQGLQTAQGLAGGSFFGAQNAQSFAQTGPSFSDIFQADIGTQKFQQQIQAQENQLAFQRRTQRAQAKGAQKAALGKLAGTLAGGFIGGPIGASIGGSLGGAAGGGGGPAPAPGGGGASPFAGLFG